jgi:hypothetical protein
MKTSHVRDEAVVMARNIASTAGAHRRTLDIIFHHPSPYNLEEKDIVALGDRIVVVGHRGDESNAAHDLAAYLQSHHRKTYVRIVREIDDDLAGITIPRLLVLARKGLSE